MTNDNEKETPAPMPTPAQAVETLGKMIFQLETMMAQASAAPFQEADRDTRERVLADMQAQLDAMRAGSKALEVMQMDCQP